MKLVSQGDFKETLDWLHKMQDGKMYEGLEQFGRQGVDALSHATPMDTGRTAGSWYYGIEKSRNGLTIWWNNRNENQGAKIAILLQYGHGTGTGGYVVGRDYINPALRPIFDKMANEVWKKVING
jgi:hypothetical protein